MIRPEHVGQCIEIDLVMTPAPFAVAVDPDRMAAIHGLTDRVNAKGKGGVVRHLIISTSPHISAPAFAATAITSTIATMMRAGRARRSMCMSYDQILDWFSEQTQALQRQKYANRLQIECTPLTPPRARSRRSLRQGSSPSRRRGLQACCAEGSDRMEALPMLQLPRRRYQRKRRPCRATLSCDREIYRRSYIVLHHGALGNHRSRAEYSAFGARLLWLPRG